MKAKLKHTKPFLIAVIVGVLIGVIAAFGDTLMNDGQADALVLITGLFNTATVWGIASFVIGTQVKSKKYAAVLGIVVLLTAVASYYIYGATVGNRTEIMASTLLRTAAMWATVGVIVGCIYGVAGSVYRSTSLPKLKMLAVGVLSVLIISENGYYLYQGRGYLTTLDPFEIVLSLLFIAGILLPFVLLRNIKKASITLALSLLASIGGIAAVNFIFQIIRGY